MSDNETGAVLSRSALLMFRLWIYLTRAPFDTHKRARGLRQHPLQGRPKVLAFTRWLIRDLKFLRLLKSQPAPPTGDSTGLPRLIWMYWDQGEEKAPELVRFCIASWRRHNPDWKIHVLSAESDEVQKVFARLPESMGTAHRADVLRLALLDKHGGVWADASTFCTMPLDQWLPKRLEPQGFFAFKFEPGQDRPLSNWFLASAPGNFLTKSWLQHVVFYWSACSSADHYFIHHYLFEWMTLTDKRYRDRWSEVPFLSAPEMHKLQGALRKKDPERIETCLQTPTEHPIYKLDWRMSDAIALISATTPAEVIVAEDGYATS